MLVLAVQFWGTVNSFKWCIFSSSNCISRKTQDGLQWQTVRWYASVGKVHLALIFNCDFESVFSKADSHDEHVCQVHAQSTEISHHVKRVLNRRTVQAGHVHLASLWPWPQTSDLGNVFHKTYMIISGKCHWYLSTEHRNIALCAKFYLPCYDLELWLRTLKFFPAMLTHIEIP